ncbi:MAG: hypothetical protein M3437_19495 [Chloroflexota bacterium]|nr:hypothetical protein [Chloroflexota bacterium]MDQ5866869.1 hypothetical protein [Chloroflexota bacterium]
MSRGIVIEVGENGPRYEGEMESNRLRREIYRWGPKAFTIGPDGMFWVADTVGTNVLGYDPSGSQRASISLKEQVVGLDDVKATESGIYALDASGDAPVVVQFTNDGQVVERFAMPAGENLVAGAAALGPQERVATALRITADQQVVIEYAGEAGFESVQPAAGLAGPMRDLPSGNRSYRVQLDAGEDGNANTASLWIDGNAIPIEVNNALGSARLLGVSPADGSIYVEVEELSMSGDRLDVDLTVLRFDQDGNPRGVARVPVRDRYTYVPNGQAIGPDGNVYTLVTYPDRVEIQPLEFSDSPLPRILAKSSNSSRLAQATTRLTAAAAARCIDRATIEAHAFKFRNNQIVLSEQNKSGACRGRGKPRYFDGQFGNRSVAYDWGGFDSVEQYNAFMAQGFQAGDIDTNGVESCSKGVDCSGFVSRCWGLTSKQGTATIHTVSTKLPSFAALKKGDIINLAGRHVVLFSHRDPSDGKPWAWEATVDGAVDRVVFKPNPWSRYAGWEPRRFNGLCDP